MKTTHTILIVLLITVSMCGCMEQTQTVEPIPAPFTTTTAQDTPTPAPEQMPAPAQTPTPAHEQIPAPEPEPTYGNYSTFIANLPDCEWCVACGSWARYTRLEAEAIGLAVGEITIVDSDTTRVRQTKISGHRLNYFEWNGERMYIDNVGGMKKILHGHELKQHVADSFGIDIERVGFKDLTALGE
jgi:hypothetical protein